MWTFRRIVAGVATLVLASGAVAQQTTPPPNTDGNDDIFVVGSPYTSDKPATADLSPSPLGSPFQLGNRFDRSLPIQPWVEAEKMEIFNDCVKHPSVEFLRDAVDGPAGYVSSWRAQALLINSNRACYLGGGDTVVDHGALVEYVLKTYAPDLDLTRDELAQSDVQARFDAREIPLNKYRLKADSFFFKYATCIVMEQPVVALALTRSKANSVGEKHLEWALIDRSRMCMGGAKGVNVDPSYLRAYVADAVYRWALAAEDKPSLLPPRRS